MAFGRRRGSTKTSVEHIWAHRQKESGKQGNVFFEGEVIYSYGHHFPMARLWKPRGRDEVVFFTDRTYSVTTSGHQSAVRSAISHKKVIHVWDVPTCTDPRKDEYTHRNNFAHWIREMEVLREEIGNPKNKKKGQRYLKIDGKRNQIQEYMEALKIKMPRDLKKRYNAIPVEDYSAILEKEKLQDEKRIERRAEAEEQFESALQPWRDQSLANWKNNLPLPKFPAGGGRRRWWRDWHPYNVTLLRVSPDGKNIQTSKNVTLPVDVAERYYRFYLRTVERGGCKDDCNYTMLEFSVSEMSAEQLVVGCHRIPRSEIDEIAAKLNWNR